MTVLRTPLLLRLLEFMRSGLFQHLSIAPTFDRGPLLVARYCSCMPARCSGSAPLLLGLEPRPGGEQSPPVLEAPEQFCRNRVTPPSRRPGGTSDAGPPPPSRARGQVRQRDRAGPRRSHPPGPERYTPGHTAAVNPSHHVARDRLLEQDRHAAERTEILLRAHHRRVLVRAARHDFDERDQLGGSGACATRQRSWRRQRAKISAGGGRSRSW